MYYRIILWLSIFALVFAYIAEYVFGLKPCILCLYERIPYFITAIFSLLAIVYKKNTAQLIFLVFLISSSLALYHVGIEYKFFENVEMCKSNIKKANTIEDLHKQISEEKRPSCSEVQFSLFGISITGYNMLLSIALASYSLIKIREKKLKL